MPRRFLDTAVDDADAVAGVVGVAGFLESCSERQMAAQLGRHTSFYAYYSAMVIVVVLGVGVVVVVLFVLVTRVVGNQRCRLRRDVLESLSVYCP